MKKLILLTVVLCYLVSCQKLSQTDVKVATPIITSVAATKPDTIPDKASFKIKLAKDSVNADETAFVFNHSSTTAYNFNIDAPYFGGLGQVSLASISSDSRDLAIYNLPYAQGMAIGLDVNVKASGPYILKLSYINNIPSDIGIYVKDAYLKDSTNMRTGNCNFSIDKANASSFGDKRFSVLLKESGNNK